MGLDALGLVEADHHSIPNVDVMVLARASMFFRLVDVLQETTNRPLLSSARMGFTYLAVRVADL
ncbi:hypothetical protein [Lacisediminihabitans profunda]|uniref:Uncharacterized protein n=1 Tax=Lacisediminihabitans profunda TaxID=2594790 RepID=A0A5C8URM6_9MICO|nr:hypothetical protein [Lacisediminihabitans profunda]TXN30897.1 hypothetical protein FVP33_04625 [Lacisediminihabitans profunda]